MGEQDELSRLQASHDNISHELAKHVQNAAASGEAIKAAEGRVAALEDECGAASAALEMAQSELKSKEGQLTDAELCRVAAAAAAAAAAIFVVAALRIVVSTEAPNG